MDACVIILDGLLVKDREYPLTDIEGDVGLTDLNNKTRNIIIGCRTVDDKIRVYRNF